MKKYLFAIVASGLWMNISEFIRNELVIKHIWVDGFNKIGLSFPSEPINGIIWGLWAFIFAGFLVLLNTKFDILKSTIISWIFGFVLLWIAMWNMGFLPSLVLCWAIPLSFFEVFVAALICRKTLDYFAV